MSASPEMAHTNALLRPIFYGRPRVPQERARRMLELLVRMADEGIVFENNEVLQEDPQALADACQFGFMQRSNPRSPYVYVTWRGFRMLELNAGRSGLQEVLFPPKITDIIGGWASKLITTH